MSYPLTLYYEVHKPDHVSEYDMDRTVTKIQQAFYPYGFVRITFPRIKSSHGVFFNKHYDGYIFKVEFMSRYHLRMFKLKHSGLYSKMITEHPNISNGEEFA